MATIAEMNKWNYAKAWKFFTENACNRLIPESKLYVRSMDLCQTIDIRNDKDAREKILASIKCKTLILIDGATLNGKSTFAERLAHIIGATIVDIDIICKDWIEEQHAKITDPMQKMLFLMDMDKNTDIYILQNLERIIKDKSNGNVILVGSYMEVIYRTIIAKTLGKYFDQVVSIYCCAQNFTDIKMMHKKRVAQFGFELESEEELISEYNYSKTLLDYNGIMLGVGMAASFIADISVSDMFV